MKKARNFKGIVGNPPYQDDTNSAKNYKLWHTFLQKFCDPNMLAPDGVVSFVCPKSVFEHSVGIGKWFKSQLINADNESGFFTLFSAEIHDKLMFDASIETCDFAVRVGKHAGIPIPEVGNPLDRGIIQKMISFGEFLPIVEENLGLTKNHDGTGDIEVLQSGKKSIRVNSVDPTSQGQLKIVFPFSSSYRTQFTTTLPTCQFNKVMYVSSEDEAKNIMSFTLSSLYQFFAAKFQKTSGFTPAVKNSKLPKLDYTKQWTDQEVFEFFNITEEEKAHIMATLHPSQKKRTAKTK